MTVQKENGHSPIAHPILEGFAVAPFTSSQLRILLALVRQTYGWSRKEASVSYADFERLTGLPRKTVQRTVSSLTEAGVLVVVQPATGSTPTVYRLQKDPREWGSYAVESTSLVVTQGDPTQGDPTQGDPSGDYASVDTGVHKTTRQPQAGAAVTPPLKQKARSKRDKSLLQARRNQYTPHFEEAWAAYPKREGSNPKPAAFKAWCATVKRGEDPKVLIAAAGHYADHLTAKGKVGTEFVKLAATFFGPDEHWRDFVEPVRKPSASRRNPAIMEAQPLTEAELEEHRNYVPRNLAEFRRRKAEEEAAA